MPAWSPDGKHIAYINYTDGSANIYSVGTSGGLIRQLTNAPTEEHAPGWSADGQWLYFSSNRTGTWQIWKQPITGDTATQVTSNGGFVA